MLRLAKRAQTTRLGVTGDHVMLAADDTLLWGRLIKSNNQPNYADVMARLLPKRYATQAVAAPHELEGILQLAKVIPDANIKITVADGEAALVSSEENGAQYEETLQLPKHPDVKLQVRARTLLDAYAAFAPENILFTKTCVVLTRNKLLRLVGAGPVAGADPVS